MLYRNKKVIPLHQDFAFVVVIRVPIGIFHMDSWILQKKGWIKKFKINRANKLFLGKHLDFKIYQKKDKDNYLSTCHQISDMHHDIVFNNIVMIFNIWYYKNNFLF